MEDFLTGGVRPKWTLGCPTGKLLSDLGQVNKISIKQVSSFV